MSFILVGFTWTVYPMLPSGQGAVQTRLWRFYLSEWPRAFEQQNLGPSSSNQDSLISLTLQHLAFSVVVGALALVVGWRFGRRPKAL